MLDGSSIEAWPGRPFPFGTTYDGAGTNFSLFSEVAEAVELCLFDPAGEGTAGRLLRRGGPRSLARHAYLPNVRPGQRYGYRVHGPWSPEQGLRCNPQRSCCSTLTPRPSRGACTGIRRAFPISSATRARATTMTAFPYVPKSVVHNPYFDWLNDRPPATPLHETIIYEVHVKRVFTARHPRNPRAIAGHLRRLRSSGRHRLSDFTFGVTATRSNCFPCTSSSTMPIWSSRVSGNYWGYNSIGFLRAPDNECAATGQAGEQVREFKAMVRALHDAGIEGHPRCGVQPHRGGQPSRVRSLSF